MKIKHKRSQIKKWRLAMMTSAAVVVLVVALVSLSPGEKHCVTSVDPGTDTALQCFNTQVEAIRFATNGRIDLPEDATQQDIHEAAAEPLRAPETGV